MNTRIEEAVEKKTSGKYNCAQAVACSFCDAAGCDEDTIRNICNAFGSGMGNMEGTCGSLVGAGVIIGMCAKDRAKAMKAMRNMMEKFSDRNHSTICKMLKGRESGIKLRECPMCVADAAEFLQEELENL